MAKAAILVPREAMAEQARKVLAEKPAENLIINEILTIGTSSAVNEARAAVERGAEIIIARGLQAMYIKEHTHIPVVEIILTGQEQAMLVAQSKHLLQMEHPHIAFVGNVFSDMTHFEKLYGITLSLYRYRSMEEHIQMVTEAVRAGADIVIGGDVTSQQARKYGIPFLFYHSTEDSIREALRVASLTGYAIDLEKRHAAQIETLLDSYSDGILMIDTAQKITKANHVALELIAKSGQELVGRPLQTVLPSLDLESISRLLDGTLQVYQTAVPIGEQSIAIWATPFKEEEQVIGVSLLCYLARSAHKNTQRAIKTMYLRGYTAKADFRSFPTSSKAMKQMLDRARMFSLSQLPVLLVGETGTEKDAVAQSIHGESLRRDGPYIAVDCAGIDEHEQERQLFGTENEHGREREKGALEASSYGTLYLNDIDELSPGSQYRLFRALTARTLSYNNVHPELVLDIRLIASTRRNLAQRVQEGRFREDLFYTLQALSLEIPPVRRRPEDLKIILSASLKSIAESYHRPITLSADAWEALEGYPWPGNLIQIQSFCERLILAASRPKVDGSVIRRLLQELYPSPAGELPPASGASDSLQGEAARIASLLEKHLGNRNAVAKELGISVTTLWRRMKKLGISTNC